MAGMEWMRRGMEISYSVLPTASDWVYLNDAKATLSSVLLPCSDTKAEAEALYYKNNHKFHSTLFLNQWMKTLIEPQAPHKSFDKGGEQCW